MDINKDLIKFVKEAKKRGFSEDEIRKPLMERGWPVDTVNEAIEYVKDNTQTHSIEISIEPLLYKEIKKRANKNLLSTHDQIVDIIRRSCVSAKRRVPKEKKLDDLLVSIFSRRKYTRKG